MNKTAVWALDRRQTGLRAPVKLKLFITLGVLCASSLMGATLSHDLQGLPAGSSVDVIVQFTAPPSASDFAAIAAAGGNLKKRFSNIRGGLFTVPAAALHGIASNPRIFYISPDRKLSGSLEFAEPTVGANIALQYGWNGAGVGVAIIDSGIAINHPDLRQRVVYSENFVGTEATTNDVYGHGTHVAGIVGGNGTASAGNNYIYTFRGIAPSATLINLRALDSNGQGTDSSVISAIDRAIGLQQTYGIRVVNVSLGRAIQESYTQDPLCQEGPLAPPHQ
jgi:serine protease AprX